MPLKQNTLLHRAINHHYSTLQNHIGDWNRGTKPVREPGCSSWLEPTPGNLSKRRNEIAWECLIANRVLRSFLHLLMKEYISRRKKKRETNEQSQNQGFVCFSKWTKPQKRNLILCLRQAGFLSSPCSQSFLQGWPLPVSRGSPQPHERIFMLFNGPSL